MSRIINPSDPTKGGVELRRVPLLPWQVYVGCGLKVGFEGKQRVAIFVPQTMESIDEAAKTLCLLLSSQRKHPGMLAWETVPPEVQRHFKFVGDGKSD